jgi:hypothetical protein
MTRKPAPRPDDPEQSKRFIEMAEEAGADADDDALERAFKKIAPLARRDGRLAKPQRDDLSSAKKRRATKS